MNENYPFFAYGTLRRGECRARHWPAEPIRVVAATTIGRLLDLGSYPGLVDGERRVMGELWYFSADRVVEVTEIIDAVEGFGQGGDDLYLRKVITCELADGERVDAFAYVYARSGYVREIPPNSAGIVDWLDYSKSH